jgi:hypothetical protein
MYSFCFVAGGSTEEALKSAIGAVSTVSACLPSLGSPPRVASVAIPELQAAVATVKPEVDLSPSLIQIDVSPMLVVVASGAQAGTADVAGAVRHAFQTSGIDGVARMEGNLSAVVVDRQERRVWVAGTLLGHRALFYYTRGDSLLVSPHDLTLLATKRVPYELDPASLASMVACDWSLTGRSMLAGVSRCHPLEALRWQAGQLNKQQVSSLDPGARLAPKDSAGIARQVDRVADRMLESVERHVAGASQVSCALTAGMDSRAVFAAICGARGGQAIATTTSGGERSLDVVVARRIARMVGASHRRQEPAPPTADDFMATGRLRAFFCSGDTNAKRSMTRLPSIDPAREWSAGGNGGEIYRGFFYQYFGLTGVAPKSAAQVAERLLTWRFRRLARLPFADPVLAASVRQRLLEALSLTERCSGNVYDMADLLYLFERYGRWGATQAALPWLRTWTPFESIDAIREAFRLPAPLGKRCTVHATLIRRFLPRRAYWIPINGGQLLALDGEGRVRYALRQALNVNSVAIQRLSRRLSKGARRGDDMKSEFLTGGLGAVGEELLCEAGSSSQTLFGRAGVRQLLDEQRRGQSGLEVIGILLTAEMWRRLAEEIMRA